MSIKYGLSTKTRDVISEGNILNFAVDTTKYESKTSTVWKLSNNYYSYGDSLLNGAEFPQNNIVTQITNKNFVYSLFIYDAKNAELISPNNLNFEILYTNIPFNYKTYNTTDSFNIEWYSLIVDTNVNATIRISGENYLTTYIQLGSSFTSNEVVQAVSIINTNNLPDGVTLITQTLEQNNNGTVQEYILDFPASNTIPESATITIAEGAKFYDSNDNLLVGSLTIKVAYFSSINPESYSLFSAGWNVPNIEKNGQLLESGHHFFSVGGFHNIEITDSNGTLATRIDL